MILLLNSGLCCGSAVLSSFLSVHHLCGYPVVSAPFIKKMFILPLHCLGAFTDCKSTPKP